MAFRDNDMPKPSSGTIFTSEMYSNMKTCKATFISGVADDGCRSLVTVEEPATMRIQQSTSLAWSRRSTS
jgi:hypothetical protein